MIHVYLTSNDMEPIVNRVAESNIEVFNLESLWDNREVVELDVAPFLVEGLILREVPFREAVKTTDWSAYAEKHVAVFCSTDAIVPTWAYMLIASKLDGIAQSVSFGSKEDVVRDYYSRALEAIDWSIYEGKPVVIKGCASRIVPANAYLLATQKLQQVAGKLMYGEPCSSVPLWRKPKPKQAASAGRTAGPARPVGIKPAGSISAK